MSMKAKMHIPIRLLRKRDHNALMRTLHGEAAQRIKALQLPNKFANDLFKRYPEIARKRGVKYMKWKAKLVNKGVIKEVRPNVLSGNLRREALVNARVTQTPDRGSVYIKTGAGVILSGPRMGQRYEKMLKQWQRDELEYVSPDERKELADWVGYWYTIEAIGEKYDATRLRKPVHTFVDHAALAAAGSP